MSRASVTQRWRERAPRWRPAEEGGFDPDLHEVVALPVEQVRPFIERHHYAPTLPSVTHGFGLMRHSPESGPRLVGVATLGVPMNKRVLTNVFPTLEPYTESLDFNRLVLLDEVPANGESWFCARVFRRAARDHGVRGVVTFADPIPRRLSINGRTQLIKPGHEGIVYQALGFAYCGRGTARRLDLLPDAVALNARSIAKITAKDSGHHGVIKRLISYGAPAPQEGADLKQWLAEAKCLIGSRTVSHPGNHRYVLRVGTRSQRTRTVIAMPTKPYPKPPATLFAVD